MKTTNIIQRLCLFLFVLVLAAPAWATDYGRFDYETFRSRNTVNAVGKKKPVGTLRQGRVEINFSDCRTTSGTGNSAIYELAKGSHFSVKVDEGYAVRWIILRDTEGGKDYDEREGIWRIDRVPHYAYFFEKTAISNAHISGGNKDGLNDDNNNIVVYNYSAPERVVNIYTHNNKDWDQFKVRDIIVGYVKVPKVKFERDRYDVYTVSGGFYANLDKDEYDGKVEYNVANYEDVVKLYGDGSLKLLHPGTEVLTAIFPANEKFAGASCSTTINVKRDRVTFNYQIERPKVLYYEGEGYAHEVHNLYDYSDFTTESGIPYKSGNDGFNVECTNDNVLRPEAMSGKCFFEGTAGTVDVTINQRKNDLYEESSLKQTFTVIRTDKGAHTMLIKDLNEWKVFAHLVNDEGMAWLNARLEADIDLASDITMVGTDGHRYSGTFDGQEYALKINWNSGDRIRIAPFHTVENATIKNLRTEGVISSSTHFLSGLIYEAYGTTTISGCISAVNITSSYGNGGCDAAGMIECVWHNAKVTITDCVVKGKFHAATESGRRYMGGFVENQYGKCTLNNCLYIGENNATTGGHTFASNSSSGTTLNNCYYLNTCGTAQGTKITEEQLKNGEVAYKLQARRNNMVWGQELNKDTEPLLTTDGAKRVRKVEFTYNSQVKATRYANSGKTIYGSMPTFTPKDLLGSDYNEHHYYSGIAFEDGFNGSTTVNTDRTVAVTFNKKDYYEIASKENWKEFCDLVNGGQNAVDAKMTRNIDLGSEINMVGDANNKYSGTFDGQNHTLKINWNNTSSRLAPFHTVDGATIKNLRTEGEINSSTNFLSGLAGNVYGTTTISGCVSAVNITSTYNEGGCDAAGMVECVRDNANVTITDCVVKGKINATTEKGKENICGFVNNQYGKCTLNNCLYAGENNGTRWSRTFAPYSGSTLNNCYYLNACGDAQGDKVTEEQLKNGEVTKKLQNNRTDKCYWAQQLGEMPDFYNAADKSKANYVYYDAAKKGWTCDDFRLTDGQPLPIGLDFTAATVTYERNFNGTQKATLCLPYDLYAQGFKAYTLSGGNKNEVHFKEVDDKLPAYTPYYITANGMPQLGGRNIEVKAYKADKMTTLAAGYKFTGTVAGVSNATAAADNAYILQDDGKFHKVTTTNSAATIPAYRAYIICPPQASGAKQLSVVLDGETTGIGSTTNEATDGKNGPLYDLQGRRVADRLDDARHRLPAGVYIVGGRKVVVK
ncbi:peptidase M26 [Prevotella multiformis]|uniref:peptidase M26 n=1 Tax=Prevotella multiformis TaxID=282402 RepID=UPI001BA9153A|nr:peptidase M26 [Prevotella multiformis]QUB71553.1 peptidase M26 [Prevotella multiformis]